MLRLFAGVGTALARLDGSPCLRCESWQIWYQFVLYVSCCEYMISSYRVFFYIVIL